jgi:transposase-like protein
LRDLKQRGMLAPAPALAVGDGALGFWAALRDVWPQTREQRDWVHRVANVLDKLPKRLHSRAKETLREIREEPTRDTAQEQMERFEAEYGAKYPKAVQSLRRDQEQLLSFYDFPAEHWKHIRTSNPIESSFATVRLRQRITKGPGSRKRGLLMAYKLLRVAEERWRRLNGHQLLPLVRAGVTFTDGQQVEREDHAQTRRAAA